MALPEKIIDLRKANGLSQEDLAERLNVSRQAISRWENATASPDAQNLLQLSKIFNVTTDYLLNDDYESDSTVTEQKAEKDKSKDEKSTAKNWIIALAVAVVYLLVSVLTDGWKLTWLIWVAYAAYRLLEGRVHKKAD